MFNPLKLTLVVIMFRPKHSVRTSKKAQPTSGICLQTECLTFLRMIVNIQPEGI